eukprot:PhF_6_TR25109/c0_g1_i3/m.34512/K11414/SIRT4, SIR2L4; NAD-dependent deacetylase sirtuin 4
MTSKSLAGRNLAAFLSTHSSRGNIVVITGAGCSTESGIPDYRSPNGSYSKGHKPITWQEFSNKPKARQRYWARSAVGYPWLCTRQPNDTHRALSTLHRKKIVSKLITQNVDNLHQKGGWVDDVVELHGTLSWVRCVGCGHRTPREVFQQRLLNFNPHMTPIVDAVQKQMDTVELQESRPDGDFLVSDEDIEKFIVPPCHVCAKSDSIVQPDIVFFGANVGKDIVDKCFDWVSQASAVLCVGTSLQVYSSYRFVAAAKEKHNIPIAIVNMGPTRADQIVSLKVEQPSGVLLREVVAYFDSH